MQGFLSDGWFREESPLWPGQGQSLKIKKIIFFKQTAFQELSIFENDGPWGRVMTLDGAIQITEKDEFVYHEMMAHVPLFSHQKPENVLIIGGGDGGVLREVLKHPSVQRCDLVDIDGDVIEQSKIYFPRVASAFQHEKAHVKVDDGAAFVANATTKYDVIIVDSSDPEGPASVLFGAEFYKNVKKALKPDGIVCSQGESMWLHMKLIEDMMRMLRDESGFASVHYGLMHVPTYPCGSIGCLVSCVDATTTVREPQRLPAEAAFKELKYYSTEMHKAAFVLPGFAAYLNAAAKK